MLFVVAVDHTLKQGAGLIAQGTGIEMNQEEHGKDKAYNDVKDIIKEKSADVKYGGGNLLRKHQSDSGNDQQRHAKIHGKYVGNLLKGIKLLLFGNGEGVGLTFKNSHSIKHKLFPEFGPEVLSPFPIKHSITGDHISNDKNTIIDGKYNGANVMNSHRKPEGYQAAFS